MTPTKRSAAQSAHAVGAARVRSRGAGTATAATAAGRLRVAAVLCSLLFATLGLAGCEALLVLSPRTTVTTETVLPEAGPPLEFTVRVSPAPANDLTFRVEIDAAECVLPAELRQPRTITIAAGTEEVTLTVPTDGIEMAAEGCTLTVVVTEGDNGDENASAQSLHVTLLVTVIVPYPEVTVSAGTSPVPEGTDAAFTLTATPAPEAPLTVAVNWSQTGDYLTGTRPSEVTIPTSGTATVTASTEDDRNDEVDGAVTLTVTGGDGYTVGTPASATVTVTDDDVLPEVTVAAVIPSVREGDDAAFTLTATPAPEAPLTVAVSWSQTGSFLTGTRPSQVTISTSGTFTVTASTADDSTDEADGTVTLTVTGGDGYAVGTPAAATVTVTDDDVPATRPPPRPPPPAAPDPVVTVTRGTSSVTEGTDVSFTLTATPAPAAPLTVSVSWSQTGSYLTSTRPSQVTIDTSGTARATAATDNDGNDEANGSVTLRVTGGSGYTVGTPASATVTVTDDDVPAVSVAADSASVGEGTAVSFTLTATPAPATPLTVTVSWSQTGSFWTGTRPSQVTIPTSGTATVTAATDNDGNDEANGSVTLRVTGGSGYTVGTPASATVTVTDDDVPAVSVTAVSASVEEGTAASFRLTASPTPAAPLTVNVSWSQTGGVFPPAGTRPSQVTISTSGTATTSASTNNDSLPGLGGSVTLTVKTGSGYTVGSPSSATVTVTDSDQGA